MKKLFFIALAATISSGVFAQTDPPKTKTRNKKDARRERVNALLKMEEEGELVFRKHSIFGFKATTDGWGLSYEIGKFKSNRNTFLIQFELGERKHKKETRVSGDFNGFQFNSFIPGKMNNFFQFKAGIGQQKIIGGKGNKNGVAVAVVYGAGLTLGFLKPYMVDVEGGPANARFRSTYPKIYDSSYRELGAAGITTGWNGLKVKPGVYVRSGMRFDYGRFNETVTGLEVGLSGEFYAAKVPQVAYSPQKQFFFNAYVALLLGRRK